MKTESKIISSTGYTSREILYLRKNFRFNKSNDFYMVGGMGHTGSVALGYSLKSKKNVICIDGDGSFLMHLGSIKTLANFANKNLKYILLNNNSHDSVGGQNTYIDRIDIKNLAKSISFQSFISIGTKTNMKKNYINSYLKKIGFMEVKISNNKKKLLPRPENLIKIKNKFMS